MTLVEFLEQRLAEDEDRLVVHGDDFDECQECALGNQVPPGASPYSHARLLREVAAKRAIMARCVEWLSYGPMKDWEEVDAQPAFALWKEVAPDLLRVLASVYDSHPDFDPAWAPEVAVR